MKRIVLFALIALGGIFQAKADQVDRDQARCRQKGGTPYTHLSGRVSCHYHDGWEAPGYAPFSNEDDCLRKGGRPHTHWSGRVSCHY